MHDEHLSDHRFRAKIAALLRERALDDAPTPLLVFSPEEPLPKLPGLDPIRVDDLLQKWPKGAPKRLERCLRSLIKKADSRGDELAQRIGCERGNRTKLLSLCRSEDEGAQLLSLMHDREWVRVIPGEHKGPALVSVRPKGWDRYEQITRGRASRNNPAFVAMWFGESKQKDEHDQSEEMDQVKEHIYAACDGAGWPAQRSDSDPHNRPVMDKILEDIRKAPFLVADLTGNNPGVYFEAGFATGIGKEVFYCCPKESKPHFDVSGINQFRYKNLEELRQRLQDAILHVMGRGPGTAV